MDSNKPTLFLVIGLPGAGKTTMAKNIESEKSALRLTPDDALLEIFGSTIDRQQTDKLRQPIEEYLWTVAASALQLGCNVVLDNGFWTKADRDKFKNRAKSLGANTKLIYVSASTDELWQRISRRPESLDGTLRVTRKELEAWSKTFEAPSEEELQN